MAERGGLAGVNFGCQFLRQDGAKRSDTGSDAILRHLDHLLSILGEHGVALGSDFDGALMPDFLGSAAGLPKLTTALKSHGYDDALIHRLCWQNWLDMIARTIG